MRCSRPGVGDAASAPGPFVRWRFCTGEAAAAPSAASMERVRMRRVTGCAGVATDSSLLPSAAADASASRLRCVAQRGGTPAINKVSK